jgi:tetratricopeptide (TPR) repeat protein
VPFRIPSSAFRISLSVWAAAVGLLAAAAWPARAQEDPTVVRKVKDSRRQLIRSLVSAPAPPAASADLEASIRRLESIEVGPRAQGATTEAMRNAECGMRNERHKSAPGAPSLHSALRTPHSALGDAAPQDAANKPAAPPPAAAAAAAAELQRLRQVPAERIADPVGVADALYLAGHRDEASLFYDRALAAHPTDDAKAWLLFQAANCRQSGDPAAATALYQRLLAEHPQSAWGEVAKTRLRLLEWRQAERPETLLGTCAEGAADAAPPRTDSPPSTRPAPQG